jgi:hypothetical protein
MFLFYSFSLLAELGMFLCLFLQKRQLTKTCGNLLVQSPISRFGVAFDDFYTDVCGTKCELRTANKLPHT